MAAAARSGLVEHDPIRDDRGAGLVQGEWLWYGVRGCAGGSAWRSLSRPGTRSVSSRRDAGLVAHPTCGSSAAIRRRPRGIVGVLGEIAAQLRRGAARP